MPLPEGMPFYDSVTLPEVLERALQTRSLSSLRTSDVLDELARQMGFKVDHIGDDAHAVLWSLLRVLEANVEEEGPGSWLDDVDSERHRRIAGKAVAQESVDVLLVAAREFGWRRRKVKSSDFSDVAQAVRTAFATELAERVRHYSRRGATPTCGTGRWKPATIASPGFAGRTRSGPSPRRADSLPLSAICPGREQAMLCRAGR